jgi:LAO/AO transport system kinase
VADRDEDRKTGREAHQQLSRSPETLLAAAQAGSVRAVARLLTLVELGGAPAAAVTAALVGIPRTATIIGLTGPPGVGKSTTTDRLVTAYRAAGLRVAVLAVDPSSPFSGGALLGDRVRMADHATDPQVYIRSMSSRGSLGGLSVAAPDAVDVLSALGFGVVIVETVGVGQNEVDVMRLVDTVVVVLAPGMGDGVQAAKAGILEVADILVVNKADHAGAEFTVRELKSMVALGRTGSATAGSWRIPVLTTVAARGDGIDVLMDGLRTHAEHLASSGGDHDRRLRRASAGVLTAAHDLWNRLLASPSGRQLLDDAAARIVGEESDHHRAAREIVLWAADRLQKEG